ncbi:hypothetical protein DFH08DRAFT_770441 [Mycena albidolilacea]|uniref:Uncharacterized protein n=1 Tax=Mycena albidolilacea TaxID=1033008 RepID=A0AAD7ADX5_9AGAR|nr:hypothetical protein DFH08DRAFT_770441 [Mycena albidolilacea]
MPSRTRSSDLSTSGPSKPWRAPAPEPEVSDVDMDSDVDENNASLAREQPRHLDDPWVYPFQPNEKVWIRNHDKWIRGKIFPRSVPKVGSSDNLTYWNVLYQDSFGHKLRKYFAPLMGELKPDTPAVRSLLREAHWL